MAFHAVPAPTVNVTGVPAYPLYSGRSLLLTCLFEFNNAVDTLMTLNSVWRRGGEELNSNGRVNVSTTTMIRPSVYRTTLSIIPLSNTMDSGQYTCQSVTISSAYVLFTDSSQQVSVGVEGKYTIQFLHYWSGVYS